MPTDHDTLVGWVREALEHIHNQAYLAIHPLARFLGEAGHPQSGGATRRKLLEAIEQLRPLAGTAATEADWRRYRHLVLRHIEGHSLDEVARALGVSIRQASRDYQQAVAAIAQLLLIRRRAAGATALPPEDMAEPRASSLAPEIRDTGLPLGWGVPAQRDRTGEDELTSLAKTLSGVLLTLERLALSHRVRFVPRVPDTLPPVAVSQAMLRQALLNLLRYAMYATTPGAEILLAATDTARGVALRIVPRPGGGGTSRPAGSVPPAEASELLATGRQLLEAQGGSLEDGSAGDAAREAPDYLLRVLLPPVQFGKILVIDDNPDLVRLFRRYLRGEPYRVIQVTTLASALRIAAELQPDVIILDILLPSQDGWDVLQQLRSDPHISGIPVVVCSVLPERALALSLGVADFLAKPVTKASLLDVLERCRVTPATREAARRAPS